MARVPMVTRTIISTKANVLCLDITTGQPFEKEVNLPRTYKDEAHLLKQVKKAVDTDTVKAVHVKSYKEVEALYGMTEQEFIAVAKELPPRAKADDAEVTADAETETEPKEN